MGLPLVPILHAFAPLAMGAIDLYRKRSAARSGLVAGEAAGERAEGESGVGLTRRLRELEESDLEQARLLSELTRQVEMLAKTIEREMETARRRQAQLQLWLGVVGAVAVIALVVALGAIR